jgi:hypothetical protein
MAAIEKINFAERPSRSAERFSRKRPTARTFGKQLRTAPSR